MSSLEQRALAFATAAHGSIDQIDSDNGREKKPLGRSRDLSGRRFECWLAVSFAGNRSWNCICDCGARSAVKGYALIAGKSKRCDQCRKIKQKEEASQNAAMHNEARRERRRASGKAFYKRHRDRRLAQNKHRYHENREQRLAGIIAATVRKKEKFKQIAKDAKTRPCMDCHQSFHFCAMDFDHRPGEVKYTSISSLIGNFRSSEAWLRAEIEKCDVVCANCHRIRTYERLKEKEKQRRRDIAVVEETEVLQQISATLDEART